VLGTRYDFMESFLNKGTMELECWQRNLYSFRDPTNLIKAPGIWEYVERRM
jgi:hypothetical protein